MKKIISGKLYDTDTAHEIGSRFWGESTRDFRHSCETLYRKRTGEYFLYGYGGPLSGYREYISDNSWRGGEKIMPLSLSAAREWAEANMDADDYQQEFGPVPESDADERVTLSISLDAATADRIRKAAQEAGTSVSALIAAKFGKEG